MSYETIVVRMQESTCFLQLNRLHANNTINERMIAECHDALSKCEESICVVVLEGLPDVFCFGADFEEVGRAAWGSSGAQPSPQSAAQSLYELWLRLAAGPYVTVAHVRGKVNAGGVGFVAASDIVLAHAEAQFSLSELLFGLLPACVMPFLVRRVGFQRANYLTLSTQPVGAHQAHLWGLADACEADSESLLRKHLLRLRRLTKAGIVRHKRYLGILDDSLTRLKQAALDANRDAFSDPRNIEAILRYSESGLFPWER